jgi:hypothetical protein
MGEDCTFPANETANAVVPFTEQIIISVQSCHVFHINELFNEVPNWRLPSPRLISTGET